MPASRNNIPSRPSTVSDFKKKQEPTVLPSGNAMVLKKTSLSAFLQTGTIPNSLIRMMQSAMGDKTGKKVELEVAELMKDPDGLRDMFVAVDAFVCAVALEPKVYPVPANEQDRDDELLYVDEMELDDKMFIFQRAVGGAEDAAPFRQESTPGVGRVQPRKAVGSTAKRSAGARKSTGG
jgi:hypothetical protein